MDKTLIFFCSSSCFLRFLTDKPRPDDKLFSAKMLSNDSALSFVLGQILFSDFIVYVGSLQPFFSSFFSSIHCV